MVRCSQDIEHGICQYHANTALQSRQAGPRRDELQLRRHGLSGETDARIMGEEDTVMARTAEPELPPVVEMTVEESEALFDKEARELLGISADEFRRRLNSGQYEDILDDPDHSDIMYLALVSGEWTTPVQR